MNKDVKIVICGLGGQGILFMAKILYEMARLCGHDVLGSETHGMSQRGGSVTSHVKIGDYHSPMVRLGTADLLLAVKAQEVYSSLRFLRRGGKVVMNAPGEFELDQGVVRALEEKDISLYKADATGKAMALGAPLSANLVLLSAGIKSGFLPSTYDLLAKAVERVSPPRFAENNLAAIQAGYEP
ncbi:MAG: indolepyruvate oxidoreductase subunit beta [Planctomycetota bacterium]|jgi:indolepyruvate ferredoxin oxidoreductase beta subunit